MNEEILKWNQTEVEIDYKENIHILLHKAAEKYADRIAAADENHSLTYAQLDAYSNAVCNMLLKNKDKTGNGYICIMIGNRVERLCYIIGVWKAGMTYVPMDIKTPDARNSAVVENVNGTMILTDDIQYDRAKVIAEDNQIPEENVMVYSCEDLRQMDGTYHEIRKKLDRGVYIIHTSGSTGKPKGVLVPDSALINFCWSIQRICNITCEDKTCTLQSFSFDVSMFDMFPFLLAGGCVYFIPEDLKKDITTINAYMIKHGITIQAMTTALYHLFLDLENPVLKKLIVLGERMLKYEPKTYEIYNMYGPTEATVLVTYEKVEKQEKDISIGIPIHNTKILIVKEDGTLADVNEKGEICIQGDCLATGYINNEKETKERFVPSVLDPSVRMYRTGDIGEWTKEGKINCYGRIDFQIKHRGYRIELDEIKHFVLEVNGITDCAVIYNDQRENKYIACFYCTADGKEISKDKFEEVLKKNLPEYMIPAKWILLEKIPLNFNGKISRPDLFKMLERANHVEHKVSDASPYEQKVRRIWSELLDMDEDFEADKTFNSLGGHSILGLIMLKEIKKEFGIEISFSEFFRADSLKKFLSLLELKEAKEEEKGEKKKEIIKADFEHRYEPFPLNDIQQAYYFGRSKGHLANLPTAVYFEHQFTHLDVTKLEKALNQLVNRHEMLRCVIHADKQVILEKVPFLHLDVKDCTEIEDAEIEIQSQEMYDELYHHIIDLTRFPCFEMKILKLKNEYRVFTALDTTFVDGFSIGFIIRDLYQLYKGEELPDIRLSFRDYLLSEKNRDTEHYKESIRYWNERIKTLPDSPALPVINEEGSENVFEDVRREYYINEENWKKIKKIAEKDSLSLFIVQVTAYAIALSRWSGENHFVINVPIFNRMLVDDDILHIAGQFGSLIFLEVDLDDSKGFIWNCKKIQQQFEQDMDYRYANGVDIIRAYSQRGRNLVLPVVFTSLTTPNGDGGIYFENLNLLRWRTHSSQVWMDCIIFDKDKGIEIAWDCRNGVFADEVLDDMFQAFTHCFELIISSDEFCHDTIRNQINGRNYDKILKINQTEFLYEEKTWLLHGGFYENYKKYPEHIACVTKDRNFTYQEIYCAAAKVAEKIDNCKKKKEHIGIIMSKGWKQCAAALGILFSGSAYVPISREWPAERIENVLAKADIQVIVADEEMNAGIFKDTEQIFITVKDCEKEQKTFEPKQTIDPSSAAYIIFTSGSTGTPKGVVIEHKAAVNTLLTVNRMHHISAEDRSIMLSELYFDLSVYDLFGMFYAGGSVYIPSDEEKRDANCWKDILIKNHITTWNTVPAIMQMLVSLNRERITEASLKHVFLSGDWIPLNLPDKIRGTFGDINIVSMGGATEASIWSNYYVVNEVNPSWKSIPYGYPLDNQTMYVLNKKKQICPSYVPGDIYIGGKGVAREYLGDEELTTEKFTENEILQQRLYFTGDLGMYHEDGSIEFLGRSDTQIKINGFRIELGEIESYAMKNKKIDLAIAVHNKEKNYIDFYYKTNAEISVTEVKEYLEEHLPVYMVPAAYMEIDKIPVTVNGKVDRKRLPVITEVCPVDSETEEQILTKTEREVLDIYKEVLNHIDIKVNDDFFRIGGDSLKAIKLLYRITEQIGVTIQIMDIFNYSSVRRLSKIIDELQGGQSEILHQDVTDKMPLSEAQKGVWFQTKSAQFKGTSHIFMLAGSVTMDTAQFDEDKFAKAVQRLIDDNEELRTEIYEENYVPYLRYQSSCNYIPGHSVYDKTTEEVMELLEEKAMSGAYNLDQYPLFSIETADSREGKTILTIGIHHIIADDYSINILLSKLEENYKQIINGNEIPEDKRTYNYNDFTIWQNERIQKDKYAEDIKYWKKELEDASIMSFAEEDSDWGDFEGDKMHIPITKNEMNQLQAFCSEHGCSLHTGILAIMNILMHYSFESDKITVGIGYAGRARAEFKETIGCFAVSSVVSTVMDNAFTFEKILARTNQSLRETISHASLPFNVFVEKSKMNMAYAMMPYHVLVNCLDMDITEGTSLFSKFRYCQKTVPADLILTAETARKEDFLYLLYRKNLFEKEEVERWCSQIAEIIKLVLTNKGMSLEALEARLENA